MPTARDIALRIIETYRTGVGLVPVRGEVNGVPAAYHVQQEAVAVWRQQGRSAQAMASIPTARSNFMHRLTRRPRSDQTRSLSLRR
jgi:hypothetical protein